MAANTIRTMAAFMYYALYKQLTGKAKSQQSCSDEFGCKTTPFKCLVTGKRQPGRPGRKGTGRGKSTWTTEEVKGLETGEQVPKAPKHDKGSKNK